jgi:hypothetical protein
MEHQLRWTMLVCLDPQQNHPVLSYRIKSEDMGQHADGLCDSISKEDVLPGTREGMS